MKKLNNQGFLLVETLIVSVFVMTTLLFIFIQFQKLDSSYKRTLKYNTTDGLYAVYNIRQYILTNGYTDLISDFIVLDDPYLNISSCPSTSLTNVEYCAALVTSLQIKSLILIDENPSEFIATLPNVSIISEEMKDFIKYINYDNNVGEYRLVAEFTDGTFATLKIFEGI